MQYECVSRDVPEPPSIANDDHRQQSADLKLAPALQPRLIHGSTLVMRISAAPLHVLGPNGPALLRLSFPSGPRPPGGIQTAGLFVPKLTRDAIRRRSAQLGRHGRRRHESIGSRVGERGRTRERDCRNVAAGGRSKVGKVAGKAAGHPQAPGTPTDLRASRPTRCLNRPSKLVIWRAAGYRSCAAPCCQPLTAPTRR